MKQRREGWALPAAGRHPEIQLPWFGRCEGVCDAPSRISSLRSRDQNAAGLSRPSGATDDNMNVTVECG
jgi:hypothetical protein